MDRWISLFFISVVMLIVLVIGIWLICAAILEYLRLRKLPKQEPHPYDDPEIVAAMKGEPYVLFIIGIIFVGESISVFVCMALKIWNSMQS